MEMKKNKFGIKVGDVFKSTHGYSMVINDFYQVIEILGTTKIRVRELKKINTSGDGLQGMEKMAYGIFREDVQPLDKMVQVWGDTNKNELETRPLIKINNYEYAFLLKKEAYDDEYWFDYMD